MAKRGWTSWYGAPSAYSPSMVFHWTRIWASGGDAEDGAVLDAAAVGGVGDRGVAEFGREADLDDEAADGVVVVEGRACASVVAVA